MCKKCTSWILAATLIASFAVTACAGSSAPVGDSLATVGDSEMQNPNARIDTTVKKTLEKGERVKIKSNKPFRNVKVYVTPTLHADGVKKVKLTVDVGDEKEKFEKTIDVNSNNRTLSFAVDGGNTWTVYAELVEQTSGHCKFDIFDEVQK